MTTGPNHELGGLPRQLRPFAPFAMAAVVVLATCGAFAGDADACMYDFAAISKAKFAENDMTWRGRATWRSSTHGACPMVLPVSFWCADTEGERLSVAAVSS